MTVTSFPQRFDYQANPLFHEDAPRVFTESDDIQIQGLISEIDRIVAQCDHDAGPVTRSVASRRIRRAVSEIRGVIHARTEPDSLLRRSLDACLEYASSFIVRMLHKKAVTSWAAGEGAGTSRQSDGSRRMTDDGYCEFSIPMTTAFTNYRDEQLSEARAKYAGRDDWRGINWDGYRKTKGCELILAFIRESRITEMVAEYKRADMELLYTGWDYNHHRQAWFKNVNGVERRSATNYYHLDAEPDMVKMIVYLTDVGEGDGPFRYVRGSHRLERSLFTFGLHLGVDKRVNPMIEGPSGHFRRNLFRNGRSLLMQFPRSFIGSTHFGDDLVEGSELSRYLLDNTVVFTRPAGSCIVFDGFLGVHAGGNPSSGERLAVQIGFVRRRSFVARANEFIKRNMSATVNHAHRIMGHRPNA